ncbi:hypothetical protein DL93DRAFT_2079527 [Clavulina sp. PMI_390]|nr:hypothetical protein DL93DRAFT_2079527 [Clavulina sp. PMI_390]
MSELESDAPSVPEIVLKRDWTVRPGYQICWVCHYEVKSDLCAPLPCDKKGVWCDVCRQDEEGARCVLCNDDALENIHSAEVTYRNPKFRTKFASFTALSHYCTACITRARAPADVVEVFRTRANLHLGKVPRTCQLCHRLDVPELYITTVDIPKPLKKVDAKTVNHEGWFSGSICVACVTRNAPRTLSPTRRYCWKCGAYYPCHRQVVMEIGTKCCTTCSDKMVVKHGEKTVAKHENPEDRPQAITVQADCVGYITGILPRLAGGEKQKIEEQLIELDKEITALNEVPRLDYSGPEYGRLTEAEQQTFQRYRKDLLKALDDDWEVKVETKRFQRYSLVGRALLASLSG